MQALLRSLEQAQRLVESPTVRLLQEFDRRERLMQVPALLQVSAIHEAIDRYSWSDSPLSPTAAALLERYKRFSPLIESISAIQISTAIERINAAIPVLAVPTTRLAVSLDHLAIARSFAADDLLTKMEMLAHADRAGQEELIDRVFDALLDVLAQLPRGTSALRFFIKLLMFVVPWLHTTVSSRETEERLTKRIDDLQQEVLAALKTNVAGLPQRTLLAATRPLCLRASGNSKAAVLARVAGGDVFELVSEGDRWTLVEYYDPGTNTIIRGWVYTRYLLKLSHSDLPH